MAIKFLVLLSVVMYASAGDLLHAPAAYTTTYTAPAIHHHAAPLAIHAPAYGTSSQQVIRSYDGTISQYAKAVDTPFSSVRKHDTRITNNLYSPGLVQYAAPAHSALVAHAPLAHQYHQTAYAHPVAHAAYAHPAAYAHGGAYAHGASYAHAPAVAHVSFDGLGAHYAW